MKTPKNADTSGHYKLVVVVEREWSDDREVCEGKGRTPQQQLAAELQDGWDKAAIAGHFQVYDLDAAAVKEIEEGNS